MDHVCLDITLPNPTLLKPDSFNLILDKACLDCIACSDDYLIKTKAALTNIRHILLDAGVYLCISQGKPENRLHLLESVRWTRIETVKLGKEKVGMEGESYYYVYICVK